MRNLSSGLNRRQFLKRSLFSAATLTQTASLGLNLGLSQAVLAQSSTRFTDYKALVCVFLYGGNDSFNMLIPRADSDYQIYQNVRQNLAYGQQNLRAIDPRTEQPILLGMPDSMADIHQLFGDDKIAVVANAGPLVQPVTKLEIAQNESLLPPQLFSHNDQQNLWQMAMPKNRNPTGWAGRMADLIMDTNTELPINLSIDGTNLFQTGTLGQGFSLNATGPESFEALDPDFAWNQLRISAFENILQDADHILERQYRKLIHSASTNNGLIASALENVPDNQASYPQQNPLAAQLNMVSRLVSAQQTLGQQRQIFYVGLGGWDTHDSQASLHPQLLNRLGSALRAFQQDIETKGLGENVTTFTLSDFGRTLTSNGDGTDHGWGGHQLVLGGAVKGGDIYGQMPSLALGSSDDLNDGRMIPTLSVEQYAATLMKWFGLSESELDAVLPGLSRFPLRDLGFLG